MNKPVAAHKLTAEQRMAEFDPDRIEPALRAEFEKAGILAEAVRILPFTVLSAGRIKGIIGALALLNGVEGDTAEVGCNAGGASRLIALLNGGRRHFACDTFAGLQDCEEIDATSKLRNGAFSNRMAKAPLVRDRLADLNVDVVEGYFPACAPEQMRCARYALVHIDVDTYRSIRECVAFFSGRMSQGGLMVIDDVLAGGTPGGRLAWRHMSAEAGRSFEVVSACDPQVVIRFL
jgi:hypothetical protein